MPTLSVVMIVKNEAHCLGNCLTSIKEIADELVVGDTGSTDGTQDLARCFGARVLPIPWQDDFSLARNAVLSQAGGDWLLHMDADEVLDTGSAARVRAIVDVDGLGADGVRADAVEVGLANYCNDPRAWRWAPAAPGDPMAKGWAGYIRTDLLRLFRNGRGFAYRGAVHENITQSVQERHGIVRQASLMIHHYGYERNSPRGAAKADLYLAIGQAETADNPEDPRAWHELAEQLVAAGRTAEAEAACRRALCVAPLHLGAATTLANILLNRGDLDQAADILAALEAGGVRAPHVQVALGAIALRKGQPSEARRRLESVVTGNSPQIMAHLELARVYDQLGETDQARRQLGEALAAAPSLDEIRQRIEAHRLRDEGERCFHEGDAHKALACFAKALALDPEDAVIHNDLGAALYAINEQERASRCFEQALRLAPAMAQAAANLTQLRARNR
jgi:Flp pilus assembly protein TadD